MQSLRTLARAAPRTTARLVPHTTRASFLPALRTPTTFRISSQLPRAFSTTITRFDSAAQELAAKLNSEIALEDEENSIPADSNANIDLFLSQNPQWTLIDTPASQEVLLERDYEDEKITVSFSIVDFNTTMMEESGAEEMDEAMLDEEDMDVQSGGANTKGAVNQGRTSGGNFKVAPEDSVAPADREELRNPREEEEGDEEGQPAFPANVNVLIQRKGKGALRFNLIAENGNFAIQSATHLADNKHTAGKSASELIREPADSQYSGPPFAQLDEEVQNLMEQYLDERGINAALALFVPEYIDVKEQREYLGWLRRVKEFVE